MDLYEELKKKIPFAYYVDGNILAVSGDRGILLTSGYNFERIDSYKKILNESSKYEKKEIQDAFRKISSFSSILTEKGELEIKTLSLKEYINTLAEEEKTELEKELTMFIDLYKNYMNK